MTIDPQILDALILIARAAGAEGIWQISGAQSAALLLDFSDEADSLKAPHMLTLAPPHETVLLIRFPAASTDPATAMVGVMMEQAAVEGICRVCGCTDDYGRMRGCFWVEPSLCSSCASPEVLAAQVASRAVGHPSDDALTFHNIVTDQAVTVADWQRSLQVGDYYCIIQPTLATGEPGAWTQEAAPTVYGEIVSAEDCQPGFFWVRAYSQWCPQGEEGLMNICEPSQRLSAAEFQDAQRRGWPSVQKASAA